jgi:hypothetical protein
MLIAIYWELMLKGYDWLAKLELLPHRPGSHEVQAAYAHEIIRGAR